MKNKVWKTVKRAMAALLVAVLLCTAGYAANADQAIAVCGDEGEETDIFY